MRDRSGRAPAQLFAMNAETNVTDLTDGDAGVSFQTRGT